MIYLRAAILTVFALILAMVGFIYFTFDTKYEVNLALESFQKNNFAQSEAELHKIDGVFPKDELRLYEAYLYRSRNLLNKSNDHLAEAATQARKNNKKALLQEIYLNQALNAYLAEDISRLVEIVAEAHSVGENSWLTFFDYLLRDEPPITPTTYLSGWMKKSFEETFTPLWATLQTARNYIEEGKFLVAREKLQNEISQASSEDLNEINLLMALSYLKEAEDKPTLIADPYFRQAFAYFEQVPMMQDRFVKSRQKASSQIYSFMEKLFYEREYYVLPHYLAILENWKAKHELKMIADQLIAMENIDYEVIEVMGRLVQEGEVRNLLAKHFENLAMEAVGKKDFDQLDLYWEAARIFTIEKDVLCAKFCNFMQSSVLGLITDDDDELKYTEAFLEFWQNHFKNREKKNEFTYHLISVSNLLWTSGQEQKAMQLIRLALTLPSESEKLEVIQHVSEMVQRTYTLSSEQNHLERLPQIIKIVNELDLDVRLEDAESLANHLEDARFLLAQNNYDGSAKVAHFVLKFDPENHEAKQIAGLGDYHFADYAKAIMFLDVQENREQFAVCHILAGDRQIGLELLSQLETISDDSYLRIGLGLLGERQFDNGVTFLQKIIQPSNEVYAALCYGHYQLKHFEKAVDHFNKLTGEYHKIPSLQGIAAFCLSALDKDAENLFAMAEKGVQPIEKHFSAPFLCFKYKELDQSNQPWLMPLRADRFLASKLYIEAFLLYCDYFAQPVTCDKHRISFAEAAMKVRRFDVAKEQYEWLLVSLSIKDQINYVRCLVHTNQTEKAHLIANQMVSGDLPLENQLQLAQLFPELATEIVCSREMSSMVAEELLRYYLAVGDFKKAEEVANCKPDIDPSLLAQLQIRLSHHEEALSFARKGNDLDFILHYENNPVILRHYVEKLRQVKDSSIEAELNYVKAVFYEVLESTDSAVGLKHLHEIEGLLCHLITQFSEIPEPYFLLGKLCLLTGKDETVGFFDRAIALDPSFSEAYKYKGIMLESQRNFPEAILALNEAIKHAPNDVEAWQELYELYKVQGLAVESAKALENIVKYKPNDAKVESLLAELQEKP